VDICISPTFLDHREAVPVIPHITSFSRTGGHLAWSPVPYLPSHTAEWLQRGGAMQARTLHTWIARHIAVRTRLAQVGVSYLLFLMVVTRKHSLEEAARFSG